MNFVFTLGFFTVMAAFVWMMYETLEPAEKFAVKHKLRTWKRKIKEKFFD